MGEVDDPSFDKEFFNSYLIIRELQAEILADEIEDAIKIEWMRIIPLLKKIFSSPTWGVNKICKLIDLLMRVIKNTIY